MTDARYPERWLTDKRLLRLSAEQHRTFVMTLAWAVSNRTDGLLEAADLPLVAGCDTSSLTLTALVKNGLWQTTDCGWQILDFPSSQTSRSELEVLENARRRDREKKARQRRERKDAESVPGGVPRDLSPGQHRQGEDRQGEAVVEPTPTWPPARRAGGAA